ncbi:MAG: caspase family protein [Bacteroidia bacterium]
MEEDYALIIGIDHYKPDGGLRMLNGPIRDANKFKQWLLDPNGGNIPKENTVELLSTLDPLKPNTVEIDDMLEEVFDKALKSVKKSGRRLYFYFAGHGMAEEANKVNVALCMANWSKKRGGAAVSVSNHEQVFNDTGVFQEIVYITDCCRVREWRSVPTLSSITADNFPGQFPRKVSWFKAFAAQYGDQAFEVTNEANEVVGIFTDVLINGLSGAAANKDGTIDGESLGIYLELNTRMEAEKHNLKQTPQIVHTPHSIAKPIVFKIPKVNVETCSCTIQFLPETQGPVDLLDGNSNTVATFSPAIQPSTTLKLPRQKKFMLMDKTSSKTSMIEIPLTQNEEFHVSF